MLNKFLSNEENQSHSNQLTDKLQGSDKINHAMIEKLAKVMPQRNITHIINEYVTIFRSTYCKCNFLKIKNQTLNERSK